MSLQAPRRTPSAPPERRGGTYERHDESIAVLHYATPTIHDIPRGRKVSMGSAPGQDIRLAGDWVSAKHCELQRRSRGLVVTNLGRNGTCYETQRSLGHALRPTSFDELPIPPRGVVLEPGRTFVIGGDRHRFVGLDRAMRKHYSTLVEILGTEDEVRGSPELGDTVAPSDVILAAAGAGHLLITGKQGSGQEELAKIIHEMSTRRWHEPTDVHEIPKKAAERAAILKGDAAKGTLLLHLGDGNERLDPSFIGSLFSPDYRTRVIVIARTVEVAVTALGQPYVPQMHIWIRPLQLRRAAIHRMLDQMLAAHEVPLRVADLTPENQRALAMGDWRENLEALRETAARFAAISRARDFSKGDAAEALGVLRNTFYAWYKDTMELSNPLVPEQRQRELSLELANQPRTASRPARRSR
jgi:hypothetical protein